MANEKDFSSWLIPLLIKSYDFSLCMDAISLRYMYGWQPSLLPTTNKCGQSFIVIISLTVQLVAFQYTTMNPK